MIRRTLWSVAALALLFVPALEAQDKSTKVTIQLRGVLGKGSAKAFQQTLSKIKGVKFSKADIVKGKEPRFFSEPFVIEIANAKKTSLGTIAKTLIGTKTPVSDELTPGVNLIVYSLDAISERKFGQLRGNLANVKGVLVRQRGGLGGSINDSYYSIQLDNTGQARLEAIVTAIRQSGIKISLTNPAP